MHDVLVEHWWTGTFSVLVGGLIILVLQGIDFGLNVVYARKHPKSRVARLWARESARSFWLTLLLVASTPFVWPVYFLFGVMTIIYALVSLIANLCMWAWKELEE